MTATAVQELAQTRARQSSGNVLAGTGTLIGLILRRERIKLPAWLLGIAALLALFLNAISTRTETEQDRQDLGRFMEGAVGAVFGPGYGRDAITTERYVVGVYGFLFFVLAVLMTMLLVARHTRGEEQTGRAELIRSSVVGRHAQLTAALVVAAGANVVLALLLGGVLTAGGHARGDGLLFGAAVAAVGLVFAGITALTVQITDDARTASGMAGATLGAAWVIRLAGDMIRDYGSPLSWFSPLAWSNQTRPFVDGRWWPLLLSIGLAAATAAIGYALSARRDTGAGLLAARPGPPVAAPWLNSPLAAVYRLQRSSLLWWTVALAAFGLMLGGLSDQIADPDQISEDRIEMFGGSVDTLIDGYLGMMTLFTAALAGIVVVLGVQAMRSEEINGRAEPLLATATSRQAWFGSYIAVIAVGLAGLLLVAGFATGIGAAAAVGDSAYIWNVTMAHLAHLPGVLVLLGIAALLFGMLPRAIGVTWALIGFSLFAGLFGTLMNLPQWLLNLSPMEHTGRPPLDSVSWPAMLALLAIAAGLAATGMACFRRRDLDSN